MSDDKTEIQKVLNSTRDAQILANRAFAAGKQAGKKELVEAFIKTRANGYFPFNAMYAERWLKSQLGSEVKKK